MGIHSIHGGHIQGDVHIHSIHRSIHGGHMGIHSIHGGHIQGDVHIHSIHRQHQQRARHQQTSCHSSIHGGHMGIHSIHGEHIHIRGEQVRIRIHRKHQHQPWAQRQRLAQHQRTSCHSSVHSGGHMGIHSIHGGHSQGHVHIHSDHSDSQHQQLHQPHQLRRRTCTRQQQQWISSF